jgi:hypothetical protein
MAGQPTGWRVGGRGVAFVLVVVLVLEIPLRYNLFMVTISARRCFSGE